MVEILHLDPHIVVCLKPSGVLSQDDGGQSLPQLLKEQLQLKEIYPVHRLDKAVGGVMVYALDQRSAACLSSAVQDRSMSKTYLAVVQGIPSESEGMMEDLLFHDKVKNKTYVVKRPRKGVKDAKLSYRVLATVQAKTLVHIKLHTGRTHQIRVQFASRKLPLVGDGRYGGQKDAELALWSCGLKFQHPFTKEEMAFFRCPPESGQWTKFYKKTCQSMEIGGII